MKKFEIILLFILWFLTTIAINFITLKLGLNIYGRCFITFIVGLIFGIITGELMYKGDDE